MLFAGQFQGSSCPGRGALDAASSAAQAVASEKCRSAEIASNGNPLAACDEKEPRVNISGFKAGDSRNPEF